MKKLIDYSYLRKHKAAALRRWHEGDFAEKEDLSCFAYENALILPIKRIENETQLFGHGGVVANGKYIESSGIENRIGGGYAVEAPEKSDKTVVYCGYLVHQWGHFLIEGAARLWYFLENPQGIDAYVFVVKENESTEVTGNYREFLELLGVLDRVEVINHPVEYKRVFVPELGYSRKYYYGEQYRNIFKRIAKRALERCRLQAPVDRIFLSRSSLAKARKMEAGMEMLDNYFVINGFKILHPEELSLTEMIFYLQNAEICAAESGTLPHNFLFVQQGKKCIIVERQTTVNEIQTNIDIIKDLNAVYIDGHFTVYPVPAGFGPYFLAYTRQFENFTRDKNYQPPKEEYRSEKFRKQCLRQYMKVYRAEYRYQWGMGPWMTMYADAIYEAYAESLEVLKPYLDGTKAFMVGQYFEWRYWKQFIKMVLGKRGTL